jgi:large subunit ribosomal protein L17
MKHHDKNRKLGRKRGVRQALLKSLMYALIRDEAITTTEAKAKELRPHIERLVTKAKKGDIAARRLILSKLNNNKEMTKKLVELIAPQYSERPGGYTRITKLPLRNHDAAKMAHIEFVK